jgi:hypothetical protein
MEFVVYDLHGRAHIWMWIISESGSTGMIMILKCVVDKVALGQVFSEYFGFSCQYLFHQFLHNDPHLSSGAGTIGQ